MVNLIVAMQLLPDREMVREEENMVTSVISFQAIGTSPILSTENTSPKSGESMRRICRARDCPQSEPSGKSGGACLAGAERARRGGQARPDLIEIKSGNRKGTRRRVSPNPRAPYSDMAASMARTCGPKAATISVTPSALG